MKHSMMHVETALQLRFESLINVTHRDAPSSRIAFNTYPLDTADAIKRVLQAKEDAGAVQ